MNNWLYPGSAVCAAKTCVPPTQRRTRRFFWLCGGGLLTATFCPDAFTS